MHQNTSFLYASKNVILVGGGGTKLSLHEDKIFYCQNSKGALKLFFTVNNVQEAKLSTLITAHVFVAFVSDKPDKNK